MWYGVRTLEAGNIRVTYGVRVCGVWEGRGTDLFRREVKQQLAYLMYIRCVRVVCGGKRDWLVPEGSWTVAGVSDVHTVCEGGVWGEEGLTCSGGKLNSSWRIWCIYGVRVCGVWEGRGTDLFRREVEQQLAYLMYIRCARVVCGGKRDWLVPEGSWTAAGVSDVHTVCEGGVWGEEGLTCSGGKLNSSWRIWCTYGVWGWCVGGRGTDLFRREVEQ